MALFTIVVDHRLFWGTGQIAIGLIPATNEILAKKSIPKKWRILFKISAAAIFLAIGVGLFYEK
jgi:hypothetical protein